MFTKLISFVCVLALVLAATSYGAVAPILVGDWEMGYDSWYVGWGSALMGFNADGATIDHDPVAAGIQGNALNVVVNPGSWGDAIALKLQGPTNLDLNNFGASSMIPTLFPGQGPGAWTGSPWTMFEMDVTFIATEWIPDTDPGTTPYAALKMILNTGGQNAAGGGGGVWYDAGDLPFLPSPPNPAGTTWDPSLGDQTYHCEWDISAGIAQTVALWNAGYDVADQYYELFLVPQNSGYDRVQYHFDAAELTPEPATIALLGLGGLSLLRVRRKR